MLYVKFPSVLVNLLKFDVVYPLSFNVLEKRILLYKNPANITTIIAIIRNTNIIINFDIISLTIFYSPSKFIEQADFDISKSA